jgi:cytochrome c oxidase cbb3-type subunit 3
MMSSGWSVFVVVLTVLNTLAAVWLLVWMRKRRGESDRTSDTTGHVWDGDLREYNNPLPRWWLWLFVITVIFAVGYAILYPTLGNTRGALGWTGHRQWADMQAEQERRTQAMLARFAGQSSEELARDPAALAVGRNLFANNCAACHGSDGGGAVGFPSLRDADWLWGGSAEAIETSIRDGRTGIMAPWSDVIGDRGVDDAVAYVMSVSGRKAAAGDAAAGKAQYDTLCIACHGAAGTGNPALGAPNLTDRIWLHGGSADAIRRTIASGRNGVMPAHGERFGDTRVKLAAAYVISLGGARDAGAGSGT